MPRNSASAICSRYCGSIELVLELPAEITLGEPTMVLCHGSIVRVQPDVERVGIAVRIEHFDLLGKA